MFEIIGKVAGSFFLSLVFGDTVLRPSQLATPLNINMDHLKNRPIEKEDHLNQTSILLGSKS